MKRLVLLRHGRTAWNLERRGQGHADVPLDEVGIAQAQAAAPWVAGFAPSVVWSSDLSRARVTATYVADLLGLPVRVDERLREFDLGERSGMTMDDYREQFPEEHAQFLQGNYRDIPGAEQVPDVAKRLCDVLGDVADSLGEGQTALVASHGMAIRTAVVAMLGLPVEPKVLAGMPNCGVAVLEESPETLAGWALAAYGLRAPS